MHVHLQAISDVLGFKFKLYSVPDNFYGVQDPDTGDWNGIVRQLLDRRADLAVASMTINHARETVIGQVCHQLLRIMNSPLGGDLIFNRVF